MSAVLEGVRVLDFGRYIAGPFCATLLADMGAEVIRIEKVDGSEDRFTSPINEDGEGAGYVQIGRNKLGLTLNPTKPEGRRVVAKLVATADVVIANLPAPTLVTMGLDYQTLKAIKDDIILTTVSAFGSEGPYADKVGFDAVAQAMSGNMYMGGFDDEPRKAFVPYCDYGTASLAAFGTLAAIIHKMKTGEGQLVEGSLLRTSLTFANAVLIEQSVIGINRTGSGNRGQTAAPSDAFKTTDGWVMVQIVGNPLYARWANLMGEDHWLTDSRFATDQLRGDHAEIISERMALWCSDKTNQEVLVRLKEARIPCGEILSPQQALDNEHVAATEIFKQVDYPGLKKAAPIAETPVKLSRTPGEIRSRAPTLGEHTARIMAELGYSDEEIATLREDSVI
jgi:crotonobetainyl-CoA:carnitine CoA-transferase CaiB-like acyl-CoA transferase|tara:strand:- start:1156 stop:2340 length:1185 start_codon:yes stop_codon:yes gene_type:complete